MKAFTLVETMVTMVLLAVILVPVFLVLNLGQQSWFRSDANIQLRQEIARAGMTMQRELKETRPSRINISLGNSSNSIIFSVPQDTNNDGSILDAAGTIEWSPNITYSLNGSNQIIRTTGGNSAIVANHITILQFQRTQDSIVRINITASKASDTGHLAQDTEQIVVKMRN